MHAAAATLELDERKVRVTNLQKPFFPELGITKGELIHYYVQVAPWLLPHLVDRAMVMRRYPNGATGESFFMKRTPTPHPPWLETCAIDHGSKGVIDFPIVRDLASLVFIVNLGCIDLNPWYARCDDVDRPDYLHFDLDPGSAPFEAVLETARALKKGLDALEMPSFVKTSGSKGIHVYVPIARGPTQKEVWSVAKAIALEIARQTPKLTTAEYVVKKRPKGRVLIDYNQNAWGRTLASVYSVRPTPFASVSMPVSWKEIDRGVAIEDFTIENALARLKKRGDLWRGVLPHARDRYDLSRLRVRA